MHRRIDQSCQRFLGLSVPLAGWLPRDAQRVAGEPPSVRRCPSRRWQAALAGGSTGHAATRGSRLNPRGGCAA